MTSDAPSLRRKLTITIVGIVGVSLAASSLIVDLAFSRAVWQQFDARLAQDAHAAALMVEEYQVGPWEIEPGGLEAFEHMRGPASVELWMDDGSVLGSAPSRTEDLQAPMPGSEPAFTDITLRDGRPGRLHQAWLRPRQGHEGSEPEEQSGRMVGVAVAKDTSEPRATIAQFRVLLWASTVGVILLAALAASFSIRTMLAHVTRLSEDIAALDATSLGGRLRLSGLPSELRPPFVKLNELLSRIEASRGRERQFNADVSHELRTPLAGLRSILEVAASRPRTVEQHGATLEECLAVVRQMQTIVENLLILARLGSGQVSVDQEEVALRALVDACFAPHEEAARRRGLHFENRAPPGLLLWADRDKLRLVVANLLSNAAEYTAPGGWIRVESDPGSGVVVAVRDSGPPIPPAAVSRLFDPFFRLDSSRSGGGEHWGIGLALVRGLCGALGYEVDVRNEADGTVAFTVSAAPGVALPSEARDAEGPEPARRDSPAAPTGRRAALSSPRDA